MTNNTTRFFTGAVSAALLLLGCATTPQSKSDRPTPQCTSLCQNQLAACTEEYPGDYSACQGEFSRCESNCESRKAMERMEDGSTREEVIEPAEGDPFERPGEEPAEPVPSEETPE